MSILCVEKVERLRCLRDLYLVIEKAIRHTLRFFRSSFGNVVETLASSRLGLRDGRSRSVKSAVLVPQLLAAKHLSNSIITTFCFITGENVLSPIRFYLLFRFGIIKIPIWKWIRIRMFNIYIYIYFFISPFKLYQRGV